MTAERQSDAPTYLGLDLGTSSLKGAIVDQKGHVLTKASSAYSTMRPRVGWNEQSPEDWCSALEQIIDELRCGSPNEFARLEAVSFCSAAHLPVLLDEKDHVVRPAILWSDQRSVPQARKLDEALGGIIRERTLNEPTCTWTLPQLMWIYQNEPENIYRARTLLSSKDYLIFLLTGSRSMDTTSAAATLIYDVRQDAWSPELMDATGLAPSAFPQVISSIAVAGHVGDGTRTFGLPTGLPVISGCLDTAAELVACGIMQAHDGLLARIGSSGALLSFGRETFVPGLLSYPAAIGKGYYRQAGTNSGAISLQWIRELGNSVSKSPAINSYADLDWIVSRTSVDYDAIIFHPYLQGERAPYWNPNMRASFSGINGSHSWPHFVRAVMEGVAFSLRDCLRSMGTNDTLGDRMTLAGGVTHSAVWMQILSDVLGRPLNVMNHAESSRGAALIAQFALEGSMPPSHLTTTIYPIRENVEIYESLFSRYRSMAEYLDKTCSGSGNNLEAA